MQSENINKVRKRQIILCKLVGNADKFFGIADVSH